MREKAAFPLTLAVEMRDRGSRWRRRQRTRPRASVRAGARVTREVARVPLRVRRARRAGETAQSMHMFPRGELRAGNPAKVSSVSAGGA